MDTSDRQLKKIIRTHQKVCAQFPRANKYFCARNIFHDCSVEGITYEPIDAVLNLTINLDLYSAYLDSTNRYIAEISFKRILDIQFTNYPWNFIHKDNVDEVNWKGFLNPKKINGDSTFLYCYLDVSTHNPFTKKKMNKNCYQALLVFSNWIEITTSFMELSISLPKGITEKQIFKIHDEYWTE